MSTQEPSHHDTPAQADRAPEQKASWLKRIDEAYLVGIIPKSRAFWGWTLTGLVVIGLLGWFLIAPRLLGIVVVAKPLTSTQFIRTLVASGHVETPFRISVSSLVAGTVVEIPVAEGQTVKQGDLLIRLDDREAKASLVQAAGQVAQAEARLRQIRELTLPAAEALVLEAKARLLNAEQSYERASKLVKDGFGTRVALELATKERDLAHAQLRSAQLSVFTNSPEGSDTVLAQTQLDQAKANLAIVQSRLDYTRITAGRDGILIARAVEVGNVVQPGKELMQLSPLGDAQIVIRIDEKNLGLIALGQKALASADAYPDDRLHGEIVFINPGIDILRSSVEVKLKVTQPPAYLKADMTVSVDIEVANHPHTLVVPKADVRDLNTSKPWLLVYRDGHAQRQDLRIGLVSDNRIEVLSGLKEGDIVLPASAGLTPGKRVRLARNKELSP